MAFTGADAALGVSMTSSLLGGILSGNAAMAQANAEKAAAEYNAKLAEMEGDREYLRRSRMARRELSSQFVQMAGKSGVLAEEGGWLEVLANNVEEYERDALNAHIAGRNTAMLERMRGESAMKIGSQRRTAALIGGFSQALYTGLSLGIPGAKDKSKGSGALSPSWKDLPGNRPMKPPSGWDPHNPPWNWQDIPY